MTTFADELEAALDIDRIVEHAIELIEIRSFPGEESAVAARLGEMLSVGGMRVELDETYVGSPSVIARSSRATEGPIVQLLGHLDTVPVPQSDVGVRDGRLWGRGACDMKGGLAVIAEIAAALVGLGGPRRGELLVTAYGQHEGSLTDTMHEPLRDLLGRGIHGDVAIVADGPEGELPITGKGSIIFEYHVRRPGDPEHELRAEPGTPNPVLAAHRIVALLLERSHGWELSDPMVGPDTLFIGAIRGGDLYNRIANVARVDGTRRYPAPRTYEEAKAELDEVGRMASAEHGVEVELIAHRSGQPFRIDPDDALIRAFQEATRHVTGSPLPLAGSVSASDLNHVVEVAGIPTVLHGLDNTRAHATPEWVGIDELTRAARIMARTVGTMLDEA